MNKTDENHGPTAARPASGSLLAGLMIGGLVGAGTMLLLAPQAGKRTRQELKEGAIDFRDRATDSMKGAMSEVRSRTDQMASDVRKKADELQGQGKAMVVEQLDRVSSAAEAGKKAIQASRNTS